MDGHFRQTPRFNRFLLAAVAGLSLLVVESSGDVSCSSQESIMRNQILCFQKEGIKISIPDVSHDKTTEEPESNLIDQLMRDETDVICRYQEASKRAMSCVMDLINKCVPSSLLKYMPDLQSLVGVVKMFCQSEKDIKFDCVRSKTNKLYDCAYQKGKELASDKNIIKNIENILCASHYISFVCYKKILHSCGCQTAKTYTDMVKDFTYPKVCPAFTDASVMCDQEGNFVGGGQTSRPWLEGQLVLAFLIVALLYFK